MNWQKERAVLKKQTNAIKSRNSIKSLFSPNYSETSDASNRKKMTLHYYPDNTPVDEYTEGEESVQETGKESFVAEAAVETPPLPRAKPGKLETVWVADCVLTGGKLSESKPWDFE